MRKNDAFDAKIVNTRLTKIFIAIFAPDERLPSSATLLGCNKKNNFLTTFHQSDLGTPEVQYDVYLTHPQGQVCLFVMGS